MNKYIGFVALLFLVNSIFPSAAPANLKGVQNPVGSNPLAVASAMPVQNAQSPVVSASFSVVSHGVAASIVDQKSSCENTKFLERVKALNLQRKGESEALTSYEQIKHRVRDAASKRWDLVPLWVILERLKEGSPFDEMLVKDSFEQKCHFYLEIFTQCIPILNANEAVQKELKEKFVALNATDCKHLADELLYKEVRKEILKIHDNLLGCAGCRKKSNVLCLRDHYGIDALYGWLMSGLEKTKKMWNEADRKILTVIKVIDLPKE